MKSGSITSPKGIPTAAVEQQVAKDDIAHLKNQQQLLSKTFNECSKLQVASGTVNMTYTFNDKNSEIQGCDKTAYFSILKSKLTYRNFKYTTEYQYNFKYDLQTLRTDIKDNKITITLDGNMLHLEDVKENKNKTIIEEDTGIFAKSLNSQETTAMAEFCEYKAEDYLKSDVDLQENALNALERSVKILCDNLGIKNYEIKAAKNNTLLQKDNFTQINNQQQSSRISLGE